MHAYNLVYPKGYGNYPVAIYDPSHFVSFLKDDNKIYYGYYKTLSKEEYESMKLGNPYKIDLTKTEKAYRDLYGYNGLLDDCEFNGDTPYYTYGLEAAKMMKKHNIDEIEPLSR